MPLFFQPLCGPEPSHVSLTLIWKNFIKWLHFPPIPHNVLHPNEKKTKLPKCLFSFWIEAQIYSDHWFQTQLREYRMGGDGIKQTKKKSDAKKISLTWLKYLVILTCFLKKRKLSTHRSISWKTSAYTLLAGRLIAKAPVHFLWTVNIRIFKEKKILEIAFLLISCFESGAAVGEGRKVKCFTTRTYI